MKRLIAICTAAIAVVGLAACGSSGGGAGGSNTDKSTGDSLKVGLISDLTGPAASSFLGSDTAAKAYINYVNQHGGVHGQKLDLVVADTTSTPAGAQTAAQKLIERDKVFAIIENSTVFFGAEPYLLKQGVPVVGSSVDGPEWSEKKNTNLFAASGVVNLDYADLASGTFMKSQGVTSCAGVGNQDPSASKSATAFTKACEAAGLKTAYLNVQIPLGSTDVGPIALAIKHSGADGISMSLVPSSAFALVARLRELGVHMKAILLLAGYGSDLLESRASVQAAQGIDFGTFGTPAEVHNPGTDLRRELLAKAGAKSPPTAGQQYGYLIAVAFVAGLKAAGANPSRDTFIAKMRAIDDFTGDGLLPRPISFGDYAPATVCQSIVKLEGKQFVPLKGSPFCGPTKKVF